MGLPRYPVVSGTQFRVGFGPRGTQQRLILTQVHVDRIAGCDGRVVVDPDSSVDHVETVAAPKGSRSKKFFQIPWELKSEEDVQRATREALLRSHGHFANRLALTPLGIGYDGALSPDQSARAMLGAVYTLWAGEENRVPNQILVSVHADEIAYQAFEQALETHFFPYRQADNANKGLGWKRKIARWGARAFRKEGQLLLEYLEILETPSGRDAAAEILRFAQQRPNLFKPNDVNRMVLFDTYPGIQETLYILRNVGGPTGEAARLALTNRERSFGMSAVMDEIAAIEQADKAEMAEAVMIERERFLESQSLELDRVYVDDMYFGDNSQDVRCKYNALWGKTGMIQWQDEQGQIHKQFISFHRAEPVTRSRMGNELFTMGMRVANREEATKILQMIKVVVLGRYGKKANAASHLLDGSQEWFLNLCADYHEAHNALDTDWYVASLPEDIGRGTLYLHFQNHAESDWDSHRVLRILAEEFGLIFLSKTKP